MVKKKFKFMTNNDWAKNYLILAVAERIAATQDFWLKQNPHKTPEQIPRSLLASAIVDLIWDGSDG